MINHRLTECMSKLILTIAVASCFCYYFPIWYEKAAVLQMSKRLSKTENYACMSFEGRLANHVWQYASIYGIASLNNLTIILGQDDDLVKYFNVPSARVLKNRKVCNSFTEVKEQHCCTFDQKLMLLQRNTNYKIIKFLQSWKYFVHAEKAVRKELSFKPHIKVEAMDIVDTHRQTYQRDHGVRPVVVAVHVRVGDIETEHSIREAGIINPPDSFYFRGIQIFSDKYKHVIFILCTDTITRGWQIVGRSNATIHLVHKSPILDMAVMAACDHAVTSLFSFSWWSGYLTSGTVVYYGNPIAFGSPARREYNYSDYFPSHWIPVM